MSMKGVGETVGVGDGEGVTAAGTGVPNFHQSSGRL
jgi:hypothetical protein